MLGEQVNVARVEPLGFVEVTTRSGPTGLASARHKPAIQESGCYWAGADVLAQSNAPRCRNPLGRSSDNSPWHDGLAEIGLKGERGFGCLPRLFTQGDRWLKSPRAVADRINV